MNDKFTNEEIESMSVSLRSAAKLLEDDDAWGRCYERCKEVIDFMDDRLDGLRPDLPMSESEFRLKLMELAMQGKFDDNLHRQFLISVSFKFLEHAYLNFATLGSSGLYRWAGLNLKLIPSSYIAINKFKIKEKL